MSTKFYNLKFDYVPTQDESGYKIFHDGKNIGHITREYCPGRTYWVANRQDRRVTKSKFRSRNQAALSLLCGKLKDNVEINQQLDLSFESFLDCVRR